MPNSQKMSLLSTVVAILVTACGEVAQFPVSAGIVAHPQLPASIPTLIPTINIALAIGWPKLGIPLAMLGMTVYTYAEGLEHPRLLYVLPNGDVLVAESNAPTRPKDGRVLKAGL